MKRIARCRNCSSVEGSHERRRPRPRHGQPITRRDFLNGVAVGVGGATLAPTWLEALGRAQAGQAPEQAPGYYPPALTGMRGSHAGSFEVVHQLRDARGFTGAVTDSGERYDLVIVGGGLSGLSAAQFFREAVGPSASILILDNHDDFGGHAKRNEFVHDGRMLMLNGGTLNIEGPKQYSDVSMGLLRRLGIDIDRFEQTTANDRAIYQRMGLRNGVFFPKEKFGVDRLVVGTPGGGASSSEAWHAFLSKSPLPEAAKKDLVRLQGGDQPDYMPGLSDAQKKQKLMHMSYQDFLLDVAKVHPDAAWFHQTRTNGLFLMNTDAVPALLRLELGLPRLPGHESSNRRRVKCSWASRAARTDARTRRGPTRADGRSTFPTATPRSRGCSCARSSPMPCPAARRKTS